jgi:glyoxylase-like metal-dependent hydrolase (beta-lactamase superfamily II)
MKNRITIGHFQCLLLDGGTLRVDGGAMYGMVPKVLWEKRARADALNRVELSMAPLLILGPNHRVLVDPGMGAREIKKFRKAYEIRGAGNLEQELSRAGVRPEEIEIVINTHLHWDHSGANLKLQRDGTPVPAFPNAEFYVQSGEWESATHTSALTRESYINQNDPTLIRAGQLKLVEGDLEIVPGIRVVRTPGHTPDHQSILIESGGAALLYPGDLIPTVSHLPLTTISSLDLNPELTFKTKKRILKQARERAWTLAFCHEPVQPVMSLTCKSNNK